MNEWKFKQITKSICLTNTEKSPYVDKFNDVRSMLAAFNTHTREVFIPGCVSYLDDSMSIWAFPSFIFVPCKPHTEYHSICCALSGIMFGVGLLEGKDASNERGKPKYNDHGKTG